MYGDAAPRVALHPSYGNPNGRPPVHYDDTPSYDDPSKFGGQSLGIDP